MPNEEEDPILQQSIRNKCVQKFADLFQEHICTETKDNMLDIAIPLEKGIYEWTKQFSEDCPKHTMDMYIHKMVSVWGNLNPKSYVKNKSFISRVLNGEIEPETIATMTPQEIAPSKWKRLLDETFKIDKNLYETRTEMATDMYLCGKCKKRLCTYFQLQTRSADEPMTTFVTCMNCGNRWKH